MGRRGPREGREYYPGVGTHGAGPVSAAPVAVLRRPKARWRRRGGGSEGRGLMTLRPGPQGTVPHSNVPSPAPVSSLSPWPAQCLLAMPGTASSQALYAWAPFPPLDSGPGPWLLSSSK